MSWWIGKLKIFREVDPMPCEIHENTDKNPSELAVFRLKDLPPEFIVNAAKRLPRYMKLTIVRYATGPAPYQAE